MSQLSTPHGTLGTRGWTYFVLRIVKLSTPHGTLGTQPCKTSSKTSSKFFQLHTVHQELFEVVILQKLLHNLSTPHGTLGTTQGKNDPRTNSFLSTPHGTLGTPSPVLGIHHKINLSTPHGTLGTPSDRVGKLDHVQSPFNSTRYIRNEELLKAYYDGIKNFQLHTVHQERAPENLVYRENLLSTPHGTLGTKGESICQHPLTPFQLHTVHQERPNPRLSLPHTRPTFNSTRYIRNCYSLPLAQTFP